MCSTLKYRALHSVPTRSRLEAVESIDSCDDPCVHHVRTLSLAWACRDEFRDFNDCLKQWTTDEQLEKRKEEWARDPAVIAQREAQRKVLEERQRQRDAGEQRL